MNTAQTIPYEQPENENQQLRNENVVLKEQLDWLKRQIFGKRSERVVDRTENHQLTFEWFENFKDSNEEEGETVAAHTRRKPKRNGQDKITLSPDLPVKTTILDIPDEEKVCQETGEVFVQIGTECSYRLAHEPGSYYIKKIVRPKYALPKKEEAGIITADLPDSLLPKCRVDESLLAEIMTKKFADHLPLYRIEEILKREGIKIGRKLLSQWVVRSGKALMPLYNEMLKRVLNSNNLFIDETPVKLQAKGKCKQAYMWVVVGGHEANPPYRVYEFKQNRCHDNVLDILKDYSGGLHSDKYAAYQNWQREKSSPGIRVIVT